MLIRSGLVESFVLLSAGCAVAEEISPSDENSSNGYVVTSSYTN
jgi:hypothetical protein